MTKREYGIFSVTLLTKRGYCIFVKSMALSVLRVQFRSFEFFLPTPVLFCKCISTHNPTTILPSYYTSLPNTYQDTSVVSNLTSPVPCIRLVPPTRDWLCRSAGVGDGTEIGRRIPAEINSRGSSLCPLALSARAATAAPEPAASYIA